MKTLRRSGLLIVIVVAALMAAPLLGFGSSAFAQCVQSGTNVDCTGTDTDGFQGSTTVAVNVTVQAGVTVDNSANAPTDTLIVGTGSTVTNDGSVAATGTGGAGVFAYPNSTVDNNGSITTTGDCSGTNFSAGIYVVNNATVTNDGTITTSGQDGFGIASLGTGNNITNNGTITTTGGVTDAIQVTSIGGNVTITNTGTLNAAGDGIETRGAATTINNSGTITGAQQGIRTSIVATSNDTITNSGTITGTGGTAISTGAGDDSVTLEGDAPEVNGLIDGGADNDTLTFAFDVAAADYAALSSQIALANAASGSLSYNGQTYFWANFETLVNMLNQIAAGGGSGGFDRGQHGRRDYHRRVLGWPHQLGGRGRDRNPLLRDERHRAGLLRRD